MDQARIIAALKPLLLLYAKQLKSGSTMPPCDYIVNFVKGQYRSGLRLGRPFHLCSLPP
jgi:hypothetical protein